MTVNSARNISGKYLQGANDDGLTNRDSMAGTVETIHHEKIDWEVAKRFIRAIYESGEVNKTKLAMKAGVNYKAGRRYINWMKEVGWIFLTDNTHIRLSESGLMIHARCIDYRGQHYLN